MPVFSSFRAWFGPSRPVLSSRSFVAAGALAVGAGAVVVAACDEESVVVRARPDGGGASVDAGANGVLPCGAVIPATYESPAFATNAAAELDLRARAFEIDRKMQATEGSSTAILTTTELVTAFTAGTPSLREVATPPAQATLDAYLDDYGNAVGRTWTPSLAAADGGAPAGGKYENTFHVSKEGVDLRLAASRTLLGGAFFHHAVTLAAEPVTEATLDRFVASFGASTSFADRTDDDAGVERDALSAALAADLDDPAATSTGFYRTIRSSLLIAKAAASHGEACRSELDGALATFFDAWERTLAAYSIHDLSVASTFALATPPKGPAALRSFGSALGLVQGLRGTSTARRRITDEQIDDWLATVGATTPFEVVTDGAARATAFTSAIQKIAGIYGFSQSEVESFKRSF